MGALGLSERIRHGIEATPILADGVSISVSGSFGIAASTPGHLLDPQEMIRLADDALYRAKKNGRNRCELACSTGFDHPSLARGRSGHARLCRQTPHPLIVSFDSFESFERAELQVLLPRPRGRRMMSRLRCWIRREALFPVPARS